MGDKEVRKEPFDPRNRPRVTRYWPGKKPEFAEQTADDEDIRRPEIKHSTGGPSTIALPKLTDVEFEPQNVPPPVIPKSDRRLQRLQETRDIARGERDRRGRHHTAEVLETGEERERREREQQIQLQKEQEEARKLAREIQRAQDGEDDDAEAEEEPKNEDEDDAIQRRRQLLKQRLQQQQQEEEDEDQQQETHGDDGSEEEGSEYETDDEEDDDAPHKIRPVFVSREQRETLKEREKMEAEEEELEKQRIARELERKEETKQILVEEVKRDFEEQKRAEAGHESTDDEADASDIEDDVNEQKEYELWKERELARIKRDKLQKEEYEKEKADIERRRNMTDAQIRAEDAASKPQGEKKKLKFMQRYYHKGAFYLDELPREDFAAPTGEDVADKTILPKVMQVKHFGRSGRTKYTHLVDQDTTDWTAAWASKDNSKIISKYTQKMAGMRPVAQDRKKK